MEIKRIDLIEETHAIQKKYGERYSDNVEARIEACTLWGLDCDKSGNPPSRKEEILVQVGQCKAEMRYLESQQGHLLLGLSAMTSIGGFGYSPHIWDGIGFASYWDARTFSVQKFITYFQKEAVTTNSCSSEANKLNCRKAVEILRGELTPQLDLF